MYGVFKITGFSKLRGFQNHGVFKITGFSKLRGFQNCGVFKIPGFSKSQKKGWSRPLTLIMELIINKVRSITLIPRTSFEIDRTKPFKSPVEKETYVFLVEQNSTLAKNGLSIHTKCKKRVGT